MKVEKTNHESSTSEEEESVEELREETQTLETLSNLHKNQSLIILFHQPSDQTLQKSQWLHFQ